LVSILHGKVDKLYKKVDKLYGKVDKLYGKVDKLHINLNISLFLITINLMFRISSIIKKTVMHQPIRSYTSLMSSSEALVETLVAHKVKRVYGIVGSSFMNPLHSFPTAGIEFISVQHEQNAVHIADGYARSSGDWGVCMAQNGPGVSNMVTGVAAAYNAHSPVVIITPQAANKTFGYGMFQEADQMAMFSKITKYQVQVNDRSRIAEELRNCFHYSKLYGGPAQLNIPRDLLYGDPMEYSIEGPKNISLHTPGNPIKVMEATQILMKSKKPVILVGGGVNTDESRNAVKDMAEKIGACVITTYLHNDSFPYDHPLYLGSLGYMGSKAAMKEISSADVVFAVGTRLSKFGLSPQYGIDYFPSDAKIIQVDINADAVGMTRNVDVGIIGDSGTVCKDVTSTIQSIMRNHSFGTYPFLNNRREESVKRASEYLKEWNSEVDDMTESREHYGGYLPPRKALRELFRNLPDNSIVSTDIGNICSLTNNYVKFKYPKSFLGAMTFGSCGYALPAAMGAKIANPHRPCISIAGDGAWGMCFFEILTAWREKIPVISVIFNNRQWGAEKKNQIVWFGDRYVASNLKNPDYAKIARDMGCNAYSCKSENDIRDAITDALSKQEHTGLGVPSGLPSVIEVEVSRELIDPFRRDAMQFPKRYLEKYSGDNIDEESATGQAIDLDK